jgi:phosphate starvation-inducible PhoH-like protein
MAKKGDSPTLPKPKTSTQRLLLDAIHKKDLVITTGPAGTGKTFLPAVYAAFFFLTGKVNKIVLTRPTVPTGRSLGYFPGTLEEKMAPWVVPFLSAIEAYLGKDKTAMMLKRGQIEIVPFEVIRGRTFDYSFVILDEAQNCSWEEIKAFVTRLGEGSTTVINGDCSQSDLLKTSGGLVTLKKAVHSSPYLQKAVSIVEFTSDDIVRSGLCKEFVKVFEDLNL